MSALDAIQIAVFIFAAWAFTYSALISRKRRKLIREIEARTASQEAKSERLEAENLATIRRINGHIIATDPDPQYSHLDRLDGR